MIHLVSRIAVGWAVVVALLALSYSVFTFFFTLKLTIQQLREQSRMVLIARKIGIGAIIASVVVLCVVIGSAIV